MTISGKKLPGKKQRKPSGKKQVIEKIFNHCQQRNDYAFDNDLVKKFSAEVGFKNPFDVTKLDNLDVFPAILLEKDYFISHLGRGKHCFMRGIKNAYHAFEEISETREWPYKKSVLNEHDTSESNILSVAYNQSIVHDFLYEDDRRANPNIYNARRTQCSFAYKIGGQAVEMNNLQIEIDLTMEYNGKVTVFEGKNKFPERFAVYQLYHPFLYYHELITRNQLEISELNCCYLLREKDELGSVIRVYLYTFTDAYNMQSVKLLKSAAYKLVAR